MSEIASTTQTIHLQSIGKVPAIPVSELKAGDTVMWNFGSTSEVLAITPVSPKFVELTTRSGYNGEVYTRRKSIKTLICRLPEKAKP